jgi:signal transduction histidine kinase/ActR/RegA family two-component response regulator
LDIADLITWLYTILFVLLAVVVTVGWRRRRERGHGVLSLAVISLASALVFGQLDGLVPQGAALWIGGAYASIVLAAYGLFLFRDSFVPSRRRTKQLIGVAAALVLALAVFIAISAPPDQSPLNLLLYLAITALWVACVGDSIVRFWLASRGRSAVQRFRLRALSVGYSAMLLYLVISTATTFVSSESGLGQVISVGTSAMIALIAPVLYAAFSPPQWLRRFWRRDEVELYRRGLEDLLLLSTDRRALAARSLDSAQKLIGAEQAVITDAAGEVLAERGLTDGLLEQLRAAAQTHDGTGIARLGEPAGRTAILLPLPFADGDGLLALVSGPFSPFFGPDEVRLLGQYAVSITAALERVRLIEALADASRAKSDFLSRMSHELRTPLNSILGFTQLLEIDELGEQQQDSVHRIHRAGEHLLALINEILDLDRIESGDIAVELSPVLVASALKEATELVAPMAAKRGIVLETGLLDSLTVLADRQRLVQVLLNLLSNAIKYSPVKAKVEISALARDRVIEIHVVDGGAGVAPESFDRLFQPFDRLGAEGTEIEGTGIGLTLSRALARLMGGEVRVKSAIGVGSDFWIELPAAQPGEHVEPTVSEPGAVVEVVPSREVILYIEDSPANVELVRRILERRDTGVRLDVAMLGQLGLDLAAQHPYDLILLDLHLPDMPGLEVLRRLRSDDRTKGLPVVVVSADATQSRIDEAMAIGAHRYLTKPLNIQEFMDAIKEVLAA